MPKPPKPQKAHKVPKHKDLGKRAKRAPRRKATTLAAVVANGDEPDRFVRLAGAIAGVAKGSRLSARTAKLLSAGAPKMAQKVIEEAGEVAIGPDRRERRSDLQSHRSVDRARDRAGRYLGGDGSSRDPLRPRRKASETVRRPVGPRRLRPHGAAPVSVGPRGRVHRR